MVAFGTTSLLLRVILEELSRPLTCYYDKFCYFTVTSPTPPSLEGPIKDPFSEAQGRVLINLGLIISSEERYLGAYSPPSVIETQRELFEFFCTQTDDRDTAVGEHKACTNRVFFFHPVTHWSVKTAPTVSQHV